MPMDRPALRRVLLDLIGTARQPELGGLSVADWAELDRIAAQHRLQPLLFAMHRANTAIPPDVRESWQAAHRYQTLQAMVQQAELAETCALLEQSGFAPIALKGAWLATHAYPEAAQRPLRDIDLLVAHDVVLAAYQVLIEAGYAEAETGEMALADVVRLDKHLPPLTAPRGTAIELHQYLWERDGRLDHASPAADEAALRARAVRDETGLRFLAPQDLLAHLIVHAVYSHRLDCGPLVLTDIDFLLRAAPIDWEQFWNDAARDGWRGGARLLLELTARYRTNPAIDFTADPGPPAPKDLLDAAPDLLLQELETRASAGLGAAAIRQGPARLAQRLTGRRKIAGEAVATRQMEVQGGLLGWAGSRALRTLRDLSQTDVRRQSRQLAALSKWLDR
jgi:Uncharacterised nucleotidyltransferase